MMSTLQRISLAVVLGMACPALHAQDRSGSLSWNLAGVSDYRFRGVSQTDGHPTAQAGLTYNAANGLYLGTWTSGVDFEPGGPDTELDFTAGYNVDAGAAVNLDIALNRYTYPGTASGNYSELITTATLHGNYQITLAYTDDIWHTGTAGTYFGLGADWALSHALSLNTHIGRTAFQRNDIVGALDYTDWSIDVSRRWNRFTIALGYYGTDRNGHASFGHQAADAWMLRLSLGN